MGDRQGARLRLESLQLRLAEEVLTASLWFPDAHRELRAGAVFAAAPRGLRGTGAAGDPAWVAAVVVEGVRVADQTIVRSVFTAPYEPGYLARREASLLERAVSELRHVPDVLLVNGTGRDHPRGAGLAVQLGAELGLPTIGVTDRPLVACGSEPGPRRGDYSSLMLAADRVGSVLRTRAWSRPVCVHPGWKLDNANANAIVLALCLRTRTPEPLRQARRLAREARSRTAG